MTDKNTLAALKTQCIKTLKIEDKTYHYYSLEALCESTYPEIKELPFSLKILLENLLRFEDGVRVKTQDIHELATWSSSRTQGNEISYMPFRVLMQDFTGIPAIADLAAMREAITLLKGNPEDINPLSPVDLVVDHSVTVNFSGTGAAFEQNKLREYAQNQERYEFFKWGQQAFQNLGIVPPGTGICHQVNIEYLAKIICETKIGGKSWAVPDTLVGTDSHTTMVNALGVLGWGVGGIEAEAIMLGQPISMLIPEVVGVRLEGALREGVTATDLVLTLTQLLREKGVVGKFVEYYGPGLANLPASDRSAVSNMAPEYGATCGFFPLDDETLKYLRLTGRTPHQVALVEAYAKAQGLWHDVTAAPSFSDYLHLDMNTIEASLAGPKRPQDRVRLSQVPWNFEGMLKESHKKHAAADETPPENGMALKDGDVVIAAITSCTNTSNPSVLMAAGLLAKKAVEKGLHSKPWVKTSLAPGSQVVTDYLTNAGLQSYLDQLGFFLVGYGCTTCIGNSGPLNPIVESAITESDLMVAAVLSGNRNFEGRVHPLVKANYLASPPLVVAYALAGSVRADLVKAPLGHDDKGKPVFLKDIWPSSQEIQDAIRQFVTPALFQKRYSDVFSGDKEWGDLASQTGAAYTWNPSSTYIRRPPYFDGIKAEPSAKKDIIGAKALLVLGDSITTDHISPAGNIKKSSPAGVYLEKNGVLPQDFNAYGARRGNHEVMVRGTFANIMLQNEMTPEIAGGMTRHAPDGTVMSVFDAAMLYQKTETPLVVIAGKEYGTGSSRDWAAKGPMLLGVRAVVTESFERIHRSNLIGMGVLPLTFHKGETRKTLKLDGSETFDIIGLKDLKPQCNVTLRIHYLSGKTKDVSVLCRIDTEDELLYYLHDGILSYVLRQLVKKAA